MIEFFNWNKISRQVDTSSDGQCFPSILLYFNTCINTYILISWHAALVFRMSTNLMLNSLIYENVGSVYIERRRQHCDDASSAAALIENNGVAPK